MILLFTFTYDKLPDILMLSVVISSKLISGKVGKVT